MSVDKTHPNNEDIPHNLSNLHQIGCWPQSIRCQKFFSYLQTRGFWWHLPGVSVSVWCEVQVPHLWISWRQCQVCPGSHETVPQRQARRLEALSKYLFWVGQSFNETKYHLVGSRYIPASVNFLHIVIRVLLALVHIKLFRFGQRNICSHSLKGEM